MITFERSADAKLITGLIREAYDRPDMLPDGASLDRIPAVSDHCQYFVVRNSGRPIGLFVGRQQSPVCVELHVCLGPECRGHLAVMAARGFLVWLRANTPYRKAMGHVPAYNRPMQLVARHAGMRLLAVNRKSALRSGELADQMIFEKEL